MHPADEIRGVKSSYLKDKRIILAVTGSIAAVETIRLARELIRHGATIIPVMTSAATRIIHPDSLWFATGVKPIIELTGDTEHVRWCGRVKNPVDLVLIAPCTANTISKIVHGIDDTAVTTFATTAIGSNRPIIIVPAMHLSMYDHEIIQQNIARLEKIGIDFVDPLLKGNKAKVANNKDIVARVIHRIGPRKFHKKKVLIIGGSTEAAIDDVRCLTNKSSGKTAVALAKTSFYNGANVTFWYGQSKEQEPSFLSVTRFRSIEDVEELIKNSRLDSFDVLIVCAALADYIPKKQKGKIDSSKKECIIHCHAAKKILPLIRKKAFQNIVVGFKLAETKKQAISKARQLKNSLNLDLVVANTIEAIGGKKQRVWIVDDAQTVSCSGSKEEVAQQILSYVLSVMS